MCRVVMHYPHTSDVIFLPREHDLGCAVVSRRNVTRHLRILDTCETKVANLQIAVFIDENVGRFLRAANELDWQYNSEEPQVTKSR